jgi:hypothetical protein
VAGVVVQIAKGGDVEFKSTGDFLLSFSRYVWEVFRERTWASVRMASIS